MEHARQLQRRAPVLNVEYDPAEGGVGYLTFDEFDRLRRATEDARKYIPWLRIAGYLRGASDPDELRGPNTMSHPPLGLPATWLAAEEISNLMVEINKWSTLEDVAKRGAEIGMLLVKEVETAVARWPIEPRSRAVRFFRCTACDKATLRYFPPKRVGEVLIDSVVKCTDKECRNVIDELMFARMALLTELEEKEKRERSRRLGAGSGRTGQGEQVEGHGLQVGEAGEGADYETGADSVAVSAGSGPGGA